MSKATSGAPLTVVLVHGAFADSSSRNGVIERLQAAGIEVTAAPNPLRGISHDSAYVASFIKHISGSGYSTGARSARSCWTSAVSDDRRERSVYATASLPLICASSEPAVRERQTLPCLLEATVR